ncbi:hypothetical protein BDM02DRAFT_3132981 [Thelephora ganbajun]|uniref:Uncharacterized protein n=1 Tax=Thelephora ganbajun TaxID=370292 RepID=A0ACB6YYS3_THEGA|nr:hypothetical protein BDM02DRAFT_3132981 [Thelephora ganbajun]
MIPQDKRFQNPQYVRFEQRFSKKVKLSRIHDCTVAVGHEVFLVSAYWEGEDSPNRAVEAVCLGLEWHGEIAVVQAGRFVTFYKRVRSPSVVNKVVSKFISKYKYSITAFPVPSTRPCPYAKPVVRFSTPPLRCASIPLDPETPPTRPASASTSDPNPTVELLKSLVPALVKDPASFEESISSICAAHNIDKSVISAVTQATRRSSVSPIKQEQQFPSGSPGVTTWYSSHSLSVLHGPPSNLGPNIGDLYVHNNHAEASHQIWLFGLDHSWMHVDVANKVYHPIIANRVLSVRANGTPSWITAVSYTTIKGRKEKAKAIE